MKQFYDPECIVADLHALGIMSDDAILVHSSYKSLFHNAGGIRGGPQAVIAALKSTVQNGTLLLPTLSYSTVGRKNPVFDVNNTPSCVGVLTEYFRKSDGVFRSLCPTHSVAAWGKDAQQIAQDHILDDTPGGSHSPFAWLAGHGGKIVMLGCGLFCNTSMHAVEELVCPDYLFDGEVQYTVITSQGEKIPRLLKCHGFHRTTQRYDRIIGLMEPAAVREGLVLDAQCYVLDAREVWKKGEAALRKDPHFFVDKG